MSEFASETTQAAQEEGQLGQKTTDQGTADQGTEMLGAAEPGHDESLEKDPKDWVSGDDPITPAQKSYLDHLAKQAGEQLPADMNKAEASQNIERLKEETGQ